MDAKDLIDELKTDMLRRGVYAAGPVRASSRVLADVKAGALRWVVRSGDRADRVGREAQWQPCRVLAIPLQQQQTMQWKSPVIFLSVRYLAGWWSHLLQQQAGRES